MCGKGHPAPILELQDSKDHAVSKANPDSKDPSEPKDLLVLMAISDRPVLPDNKGLPAQWTERKVSWELRVPKDHKAQ